MGDIDIANILNYDRRGRVLEVVAAAAIEPVANAALAVPRMIEADVVNAWEWAEWIFDQGYDIYTAYEAAKPHLSKQAGDKLWKDLNPPKKRRRKSNYYRRRKKRYRRRYY